MKSQNIERRNNLICEAWEKYKNSWTMEDLANIFNISLKSTYRIISNDNNNNHRRGR